MNTSAETLDAGVSRDSVSMGGPGGEPGSEATLANGAHLGRYVILRRLGAGGMGTVYLAYDPELDRKVAVKLLHGGAKSEVKRRALIGEAQAMAKLAHPHVVTVHDVGEHQGLVYVAMEFIEGQTLERWLQAQRRTWREVLEKFLCAGQGLHAAHARGLIHRDFKPDNVMVSDDGRVQVMDFGLARPRHDSAAEDPETQSLRGSALTRATVGRLAGTPAYMAPEQIEARELSPAADQFAFCVSVWEAICGERPHAGETIAELYLSTSEGEVRAPPTDARMPRWLRRVLVRGLQPEAKDRWPSMAELLDALERGLGRWRWQLGLGGAAVLVAALGMVVVAQKRRVAEELARVEACRAEGSVIDEIWNDEQRERLRSAMLATNTRFAQSSLDTFVPWLDDYRDAWSSGRTEACKHGTIQRDWDADLLDRSAWCFEDRRLQLEATVEQIAASSPVGSRRAVRLVSYLDPVEACLDPELLRRLPVPPEQMRDEIRSIRSMLAESDGHRHAGRYQEALDVAHPALARAEALGWPPLTALARFIVGRCSFSVGRYREAGEILTQAFFEAQEVGSTVVAFRSARTLISVMNGQRRYQESELWARYADLLSSSLVDLGGLDEAEGHYLRSMVHVGTADYEAAAAAGERALAIRTTTLGAEHPITAAAMRRLGVVYQFQERDREALALFEQAYEVWNELDPQHPYVASMLTFRGDSLRSLGRLDEALALYQRSLERSSGSSHSETVRTLRGMGNTQLELGQLAEAEKTLRRVMTIRRDELGTRHLYFALARLDLSVVERRRGRYDNALEHCDQAREIVEFTEGTAHRFAPLSMERAADVFEDMGRYDEAVQRRRAALSWREEARGAEDRQLIRPLVELGDTQRRGGMREDARRSYERALVIGEKVAGEADEALVPSLVGLVELALEQGNAAVALRTAERAVGIVDQRGSGPRLAAGAHFGLARALVASGGGDGRARALAERARDEYATLHDEDRHAEVERWLAGG